MEVKSPFVIHDFFSFLDSFLLVASVVHFCQWLRQDFCEISTYIWLISFGRSKFLPKLTARKSFISFSATKCWRSLFRVLTLELNCVLRFSIIKKFGKWSVFFLLYFHFYSAYHLSWQKIMNKRVFILFYKLSRSKDLRGQPVSREYVKKFIYLFLWKFSRLIFKYPVNITFLFSLESASRVCFKYGKKRVSFYFECLYTTPTKSFSLLLCII